MIRVHDEWGTPAFDLAPAADDVGPFPGRELLRAWWELRAPEDAALMLCEGHGGLLPLWRNGRLVEFLGEPDLVDYHAPLGSGIAELTAAVVDQLEPGTSLTLDSLPHEASELIVKGLRVAGAAYDVADHEVAAVLELPPTFEAYLDRLDRKERHELRRKRRRFEAALGAAQLRDGGGRDELAEFARLHRMAAGPKGRFLTGDVERFFARLLADIPGARVDLLRGADGGPAIAAAFGFVRDGTYYLYNSAYDPEAAAASPGVVLLAALIERFIAAGLRRFDFLKGDEKYKLRMGAERRPLYVVTGTA